jgi:hypothetical protein
MALVLKDRVQQTGTANTTVSFTLSGSVTGYQSFSVVGDTNTTYYAATDASGNWEAGLGTYSTTGPTLTRTTILSSSNSGSAVTFSGTVNVFLTYPSSRALYLDGTSANINVSQAAFTANGIPYASSTSALTTGSALTYNGTKLTVSGNINANNITVNNSTGFGGSDSGMYATTGKLNLASSGSTAITINSSAYVGVYTTTPTAKLHIVGTGQFQDTVAPTATNAFMLYSAPGTVSGFPGGTLSASQVNVNSFLRSTLDYGDSVDTYSITNAVTLYIENAPAAGAYNTIGNSYALYVAAGAAYFGGSVTLASGGAFSGTITGTPTFSGAVVLSGTPSISSGASLSGTFSGTPTFSGATTQSGGATFSNTAGTKITLSGNVSRTSWALTGPAINVAATTFTSSNVLTGVVGINTLNVPTIVSTGTGTATDVANLYVAAPALSTNMVANTTNRWAIYTPFNANGDVYVGGTRLHVRGNGGTIPAASFGSGFGCGFVVNGATYTSAAGVSGSIAFHSIGRPTIAAVSTGQTVSEMYTLYLENSPSVGSNVSGTGQPYYNLYVANGTSFFNGNIVCNSPCTSISNSNAVLCKLQITGPATVSLNSVAGVGIRVDASTYTDSNSSTVAATAIHAIAAPTITNDTAAITYTNVSTLYIAAAPIASASGGFSPTFTNAYSLYIAAGASYFGGAVTLNSGGALSGTFTGAHTYSGAVTLSGGGALTGTFTGTPTFSGAITLSGTPSISTGASLAGTFTGTPTFSGAVVLSGTPSISNGAALTGIFSGNPAFSGNSRFGGTSAATVAVDVTGAVLATGNVTGGYSALATGATAMAFGSYNVVKVTPNATASYTTTVPAAGTRLTLIVLTSGTSSYVITFSTGFKTTGTLTTGTTSARYFMVSFVSDGTYVLETARTVAIA